VVVEADLPVPPVRHRPVIPEVHKCRQAAGSVSRVLREREILIFHNNDVLAKSNNTPSPLMGEGRGEGEYNDISVTSIPLPFIPSRQGRGSPTFC